MSDANPNPHNLQSNERVLDYVLQERIGIGGYGEVWSVEAPGGMIKAAKFIFGFHDEKRAQREMKALDRIKHIRHPFLLSLERIDIVDGRLVIITELAEMCMKVRFNQCLEANQVGIGRDELIGYMRESADALDFIADSHGLAHLDIKPENILLVGGHAKVADFGLVKDIAVTNQSLMEGLTPAYAAPELFDGQPGRASDQYSLAIVYQEMFTGTRPFSGTTAAQLANQHLHSRPNLNELPRSDQAVIARALAKKPEKRYPTCAAFIEELSKRKSRVRRKSSETKQLDAVDTAEVTNPNCDVQPIKPDITMTMSESVVPAVKFVSDVEKLEPFTIDESAAEVRPTLFIGVGNTGAKALCNLRRRFSNHFGDAEEIPSMRMLAIDVDRRTLFEATMGEDSESLRNHEILNIPLRRPAEYRNDPNLDVSWIGRRWIYNIPKSHLTESLRPLGRLAYVDHHEAIYRRISDELTKIARPEALATTAETMELNPSKLTPQVIFVGSVAGGIGSGMLLDLAYTTRVCMGELGLVDDHLFGVFTHSTSRNGGDHRLAIANSYSFLNEMYHFNLNGYPGNEACNIPEFDDETPVFDGTYFVHFGDDLKEREYDRSVDGLGEYLFVSTSTRCKAFFDECRETSEYEAGSIKSMGINFISRGEKALSDTPSDYLIDQLLKSWLESPEDPEKIQAISEHADSLFDLTSFASDELEATVLDIVYEQLDDTPIEALTDEVNALLEKSPNVNPLRVAEKFLAEKIGTPGNNQEMPFQVDKKRTQRLCEILALRIAPISRAEIGKLERPILDLIDVSEYRLHGAIRVTELLSEHMQVVEVALENRRQEFLRLADSCQSRMAEALKPTSRDQVIDEKAIHQKFLNEMIKCQLWSAIDFYKRRIVINTRNELSALTSRIVEYSKIVEMIRSQTRLPVEVNDVQEHSERKPTLYRQLVNYVTEQNSDIVDQLEARLIERILEPEGGLQHILQTGGNLVRRVPTLFKRETQNMLCQNMKELRLDSMMVESNMPAETIAAWIGELVHHVTPLLYQCGGTSRLLIAVPQKAPIASLASFIQNQLDFEANIVPSTSGEFVVCMEMDQMPSENAAMTILQMQPDCTELIERLHCRNDVEWSSLTPMC